MGGRAPRGVAPSTPAASSPAAAKERALRLLAVRSRSRAELARRLRMAGFDPGDVEAALDDLEAVGLVDDERFARDLAADQVGRRRSGRRAALVALRRAGIAPDLAERSVDEAAGGGEEERADELARARARRLGGLPPEVAYRRLVGFLQRRGYDGATARDASRRALEELAGPVG